MPRAVGSRLVFPDWDYKTVTTNTHCTRIAHLSSSNLFDGAFVWTASDQLYRRGFGIDWRHTEGHYFIRETAVLLL